MPARIAMKTPLVEMDGDEMTRILWGWIKERLLAPHVELKTEYFDLGVQHRDATGDRVTVESAEATKRLGVAVKCATITTNAQRVKEYGLKQLLPSPNATIRSILDGTVFRKAITVKNLRPSVPAWTKPIIIGRHAYGDVYKGVELAVPGPGKAELVFTGADGTVLRQTIQELPGAGVLQGIHNLDGSIEAFARACCIYALSEGVDLWFGAKDTISKVYDGRFKEVFARVHAEEFAERFEQAGIRYVYTLIDDTVARVMRSEGGFLWACKNYDGDVMSDMVASVFGSVAMMTSVLVSPSGCFEFEAAHGTVQQHYYRYMRGEKTSTNPIALVFAWSGALRKRAELDGLGDLARFADRLERATYQTIEDGCMTADLARLAVPPARSVPDSEGFLAEVAARLERNRD